MTAIVGILNKRGVAIAADSAVTVGNGDNVKIYNTSQKIFKLSEKNPLALMIYDSHCRKHIAEESLRLAQTVFDVNAINQQLGGIYKTLSTTTN